MNGLYDVKKIIENIFFYFFLLKVLKISIKNDSTNLLEESNVLYIYT